MQRNFSLHTKADGTYLSILGVEFGPFHEKEKMSAEWAVERFARDLHTFCLSKAAPPADNAKK